MSVWIRAQALPACAKVHKWNYAPVVIMPATSTGTNRVDGMLVSVSRKGKARKRLPGHCRRCSRDDDQSRDRHVVLGSTKSSDQEIGGRLRWHIC